MEDTDLDFLGEPKFGGKESDKKWKNAYWSLDFGTSTYRILPPFGLLANKGVWMFYDAVHWGYQDSKGKKKPFRCIRNRNQLGMTTQECPECLNIERHVREMEEKEESLKKAKLSPEQIKEELTLDREWLSNHKLDKSFSLNVMNQSNEIGRLKIKPLCKKALKIQVDELLKTGLNPISSKEGVFFEFQRIQSERGSDYIIKPQEEQVEVGGRKFSAPKTAPLTRDVLLRMKDESFELSTFYKTISEDQISMLVSSGGDSSIVDSVFGAPSFAASSRPATTKSDVEEDTHTELPKPSGNGPSAEEFAKMFGGMK